MKHPPRNIVIDWLNTVWSTDLPSNAKLVACNLRRYMNSQHDMAWPSVARIAGECGISEQTVRKHLKILCAEGWLQQVGKSDLETFKYQAQTPPAIAAPPATTNATPCNEHTYPPATIAPELNKGIKQVIKQEGVASSAWFEWVNYRKEIKKKMTPATVKKQVAFLQNKPPAEQQAIIDQSITNGWTGLFEVKTNANTTRPTQSNKDTRRLSAGDRARAAINARNQSSA
jgi:hypothetical protein